MVSLEWNLQLNEELHEPFDLTSTRTVRTRIVATPTTPAAPVIAIERWFLENSKRTIRASKGSLVLGIAWHSGIILTS